MQGVGDFTVELLTAIMHLKRASEIKPRLGIHEREILSKAVDEGERHLEKINSHVVGADTPRKVKSKRRSKN